MTRPTIVLACSLIVSSLQQACGSNPCPAVHGDVGKRFVSPENEALVVHWESSRYDPNQQCLRTDSFVIEGVTGFRDTELDVFLEEHVRLPEQVRGASIGPIGDGAISMTVSLFDRARHESYTLTITLDGARLTAVLPLQS